MQFPLCLVGAARMMLSALAHKATFMHIDVMQSVLHNPGRAGREAENYLVPDKAGARAIHDF